MVTNIIIIIIIIPVLLSGVVGGDQSVYPSSNVVSPLTSQEYTDTVDNTAYYNQGDYSQGVYDYTQYSDTDRLLYRLYIHRVITTTIQDC